MKNVKLYEHKLDKNKLYVFFEIYTNKQGLCGNDYECKPIKRYMCLTPDYKPQTTTIDNLNKNYKIIKNPKGIDKQKLNYMKNS